MTKATILVAIGILILSCGKSSYPPTGFTPDIPDNKEPETETVPCAYALGADISWVTQMEGDGVRFYNSAGVETECTALMKEIGFDAIRLRVWVDPEDGWCGKDDVLVKARRAQELGMRIMIDFHYSDSWADPSKQITPSAWKDYGIEQMTDAVQSHTAEVLQLLKDNGIEVEWIQTGNEVNGGMLHPLGKVEGRTCENFIRLARAGRNAAKEIYPDVKTIIHVSNGHEEGLFDWFFNLMKLGAADYDIIGMSLYPAWWENNGWCDWKVNVDACLKTIRNMSAKYRRPVMICEFGMPVWEPQMSKDAIQYLLDETEKIEQCQGVFWWEPQTDGVWKPSNYKDLGWNAYDKGAFKDGKATIALDLIGNRI